MSLSTPVEPAALKGRLQLLLLAALFFLPLIGSFVLYFGFPDLRPAGTTNYGELIAPALPAPTLRLEDATGRKLGSEVLQDRWSLVTLAGAACDAACAERLVMTRQVRTAMNADRLRIQRLLVVDDVAPVGTIAAAMAGDHPDLRVLADRGPPGHRLRDFFGGREAVAFLLDPHGNWMLAYPAGRDTQSDFKGIRQDLKKLLGLSQIG